jgi:hypothetical protein
LREAWPADLVTLQRSDAVDQDVATIANLSFSDAELKKIAAILD